MPTPLPGGSVAGSYFGDLLTATNIAANSAKESGSAIVSADQGTVPLTSPKQPPTKNKPNPSEQQLLPLFAPGFVPIPVLTVPAKAISETSKPKIDALIEQPGSVAPSLADNGVPGFRDDKVTPSLQRSSAAQAPALANSISQDAPQTIINAATRTTSPKVTPDLTGMDSVQKSPPTLRFGNFKKQETLPEVRSPLSPQAETQSAAMLPDISAPVAPARILDTAAKRPMQTDKLSPTESLTSQPNAQIATEGAAALLLSRTEAETLEALCTLTAQPNLQVIAARRSISGPRPNLPTYSPNSPLTKTNNGVNPVSTKIQSAAEFNSSQIVAKSPFTSSIDSAKAPAAEGNNSENRPNHILKPNAPTDVQLAASRKSNNLTHDAENPRSPSAQANVENQTAGSVSSSSDPALSPPAVTNMANQLPPSLDQSSQAPSQRAEPGPGQSEAGPAQISTAQPVQVHAARIIQSGSQSEMRVEMRTQAFGTVEIRATVSGKDVQLSMGADRGDLHSSLAPEIPVLQNALQQHDLRLEHVRTLSPGNQTQPDFSSGSGRQGQRFQRPTTQSLGIFEPDDFEEGNRSGEPITRLSVSA